MNQTSIIFLDILKAALEGKAYTPEAEITAEAWERVLKLSQEHQVLPMVFEACYQLPGLAGTPLLAGCRQQVMRDVFLQTRKTMEFLSLYKTLRKAGVTPLVVKGIICRNLYPQPDYRASSDEDVLIRPEQFGLCHEAMLGFGMETTEDPEHFAGAYEIPYGKKGSPLYIELHKQLFPSDQNAYDEFNDFFEDVHSRAVEETIEGTDILTMEPTDHLFYLICHAFKHFLHGGFGIRQVCDIVLFARHYHDRIDWEQVLANCGKIRAEKFTAALFAIGRNHLGQEAPLPGIWQMEVDEQAMLEDLLASGIYGGADMDRKHSGHMTLNAVTRQKQGKSETGGLMKSLFPSASSLEGRYAYLKKRPYLLPVAWASRIVRYGVRNAGTDSAAKTIQIGNERINLMKQYGILDE